eukprot:Rhum_TRINITY_DN11471_c0_g1::Rhum_TRINITY_DN11471_c0_g1_i1::g.44843::m.44843
MAPQHTPSAAATAPGATASAGPPRPPPTGLHHDEPAAGGLGGGGLAHTLFNLLPFLTGLLKQLPGAVLGFTSCFVLFVAVWGSEVVAHSVYPAMLGNSACIALMIVFAGQYQSLRESATVRTQVRENLKRGQESTEVFYRAPKLD